MPGYWIQIQDSGIQNTRHRIQDIDHKIEDTVYDSTKSPERSVRSRFKFQI